jgi:DNA invertase Pin-like site-specific DNA recombinase
MLLQSIGIFMKTSSKSQVSMSTELPSTIGESEMSVHSDTPLDPTPPRPKVEIYVKPTKVFDRAAIYCRVSSNGQNDSLENQVNRCKRLLDANFPNLRITEDDIFCDTDNLETVLDGTSLEQLLHAVDSKKYSIIIVTNNDRLFRSTNGDAIEKVKSRILATLRRNKIRLVSESETIEISEKYNQNQFMAIEQGSINKEILVSKTQAGLTEKIKTGTLDIFWNTYGYKNTEEKIFDYAVGKWFLKKFRVINETEAKVIRDIFNVAAGATPDYLGSYPFVLRTVAGITKWLNQNLDKASRADYCKRRGLRPEPTWSESQVRQILQNETYMGEATYIYGKKNHAKEILTLKIPNPQIVPPDLFMEASKILKIKNQTRFAKIFDPEFPLNGLLKCRCGATMVLEKESYYRCTEKRTGGLKTSHDYAQARLFDQLIGKMIRSAETTEALLSQLRMKSGNNQSHKIRIKNLEEASSALRKKAQKNSLAYLDFDDATIRANILNEVNKLTLKANRLDEQKLALVNAPSENKKIDQLVERLAEILRAGNSGDPIFLANFVASVEFESLPLPALSSKDQALEYYKAGVISHAEFARFIGLSAGYVKIKFGPHRHELVRHIHSTNYMVKITFKGGVVEERLLYEPLLEGAASIKILKK